MRSATIYGWTKDAAGNVIGSAGEVLCTLGPLGTCLYWNVAAHKWLPQDNAAKLANAVNQTGVQALANPCTPALWYLASAGGAVLYSATTSGGAVFPESHETLKVLKTWYDLAPGEVQGVVQLASVGAMWLTTKAAESCSSLR
jgi:hypothetical protein